MQQVYHSHATTNLNIRYQLQSNSGSNSELASRFKNKQLKMASIKTLVFKITPNQFKNNTLNLNPKLNQITSITL